MNRSLAALIVVGSGIVGASSTFAESMFVDCSSTSGEARLLADTSVQRPRLEADLPCQPAFDVAQPELAV